MVRNWWLASLALVCGVVLAAAALIGGDSALSGVMFLVPFLVVAGLLSPLLVPQSVGAAQAGEKSASDGRPIIYWRPGCRYCLRLRLRLGRDGGRAHWVNIWSDPEGAAAVRAVTGGDETVPTVVAGAESFVNPDPTRMRELLRTH